MQNWQTLEIPAGRDGINRIKNVALVRPSHLAYADTITAERFVYEKLPGAAKVNTVALSGKALGHWDFMFGTPITQELVAYVDDGATASLVTVNAGGVVATLKAGLTTGGFPWFEEGWTGTAKALYLYNGLDTPQLYLGGGGPATDLPSPAGDWAVQKPAAASQTQTHMVAWGNTNFPHNLYLTIPGNHNDFAGSESSVQRMFPGEGERITSGTYFGTRFFVGKFPQGIYYLDEGDPDISKWSTNRVTTSVGTSGPGCLLDIGDDLIILGTDGYFYALSQVQTQGQVEIPPFMPQETSDFIKEKLNLPYLNLTRSIWFGHKRQAWFAVPTGNATYCNALLIFDLMDPQNPKFLFSSRDVCPSLTLRRATISSVRKPSFGDNNGFIWQGDQTARTKDGNGYACQYETVSLAVMPAAISRANLHELQVVMQPQGNWDLSLEVQRDGQVSQSLTYSMNTPGAAVGSVSLDSDVLAGQTIANVRHRLEGDCHYIKLIGRNANANENFAVMSHLVRFTQGNER